MVRLASALQSAGKNDEAARGLRQGAGRIRRCTRRSRQVAQQIKARDAAKK